MTVTYKALPFPLPETEQQTLRRISEKVRKHYADRVNKAVGPKNADAYSQSLRELEEYVEWLREHYGIEVTRPRIRPNN